MAHRRPLAVIIEADASLASTIADALAQRGYEVERALTHAHAALMVSARDRVDFLIAAVPLPGDGKEGAYLKVAQRKNMALAMVVMLSEPEEATDDIPPTAVTLVKPFDLTKLARATEDATFPHRLSLWNGRCHPDA